MGCGMGPHAELALAEAGCANVHQPNLQSRKVTATMAKTVTRNAVIVLAALFAASPAFSAKSAAAKPDFSGIWERYPDPYGDGPAPEDPPPPGGGPTLKEPYAAQYKEFMRLKAEGEKNGQPVVDPSSQCVPEGMPTIMAAVYPIEILQTPKELVVLAEFLTQTRRIFLNEKMPPADEILPGYNGYSVGHWEGKTLVVQTRGVREDVKFLRIPHSDQMVITERFRRTGPELMEIDIKIDDPQYLAKPYEFTFGYRRNHEYRMMEFVCDNNRYSASPDGTMKLDVGAGK